MDSLLDGELNTHRVDRMVAAPPPTAKKKRTPRGVLMRKDTEDGPLEIILPEDSLWCCPKRVGRFGYSTDFPLRKTVRSDNDSIRNF